ncbi:ADP-ribose pyrophosphatase [Saccharothrix ecbatanensis]|uniref:ADP-ribose pyrophosphatase n=1 Tax=Saccharothrix ecbatanensis TaxID=1105145 RepID=A0A7W9M5G5_9PSEU|nr:NUDIX domain-containing protein [Saccharothrix ecbatanensis]MBB5807944.1 ADP-ribose pyrophosphatase [Saccharothrix ecbatanensis]
MEREEHRRWQLVERRTAHVTPWFEVLEDDVVRPDGLADVYHHVVAPESVTVLAIDEHGQAAVTRQWIYTHQERQWRLPAGAVDKTDADPAAAAARELAEETGVRAARWERLVSVNGADSFTNHVDHVFLATDLVLGAARQEGAEADLVVHWLPVDKVLALVAEGEIRHAGSVGGLLAYGMRRDHPTER